MIDRGAYLIAAIASGKRKAACLVAFGMGHSGALRYLCREASSCPYGLVKQ